MDQYQQQLMDIVAGNAPGMQQQAEQESTRNRQQQPQFQMPDMTPRMPRTEGWPNRQDFSRYGVNIARPTGNYLFSYERSGENLNIYIWKNMDTTRGEPTQNFTEAEVLAICRHFEPAFGSTYANGSLWRDDVIRGSHSDPSIQDPQRRNTSTMRYSIVLEINWMGNRGVIEIKIYPAQSAISG